MLATIGKTAGTPYAARDCARTGMAFGHPSHNLQAEPRPSIDCGAWAARIALTAIAAAVVFVLARPFVDAYRATHPAAHVQAGRG